MNPAERIPVLLVDDRQANLLALEAVLAEDEYALSYALSGQEALRTALKQDYALVLLDVQMPDMDGFETAELMRSNPKTRNVPIIFVTAGMKDAKHLFKGYESGAVDYLLKPLEPAVLRSKVRVFAELYRQRLQIERHDRELQLLVDRRTQELAANLQEKEVLLKEIFHRVKNNLQVVSSLLMMQARSATEPGAQAMLNESADRVRSIALVHEQLYQSNNLAQISYPDYVRKLITLLAGTYDPVSKRVPIRSEIDNLQFGIETAIPLGLIITELIANAYKHAFPAEAAGEINVTLHKLPNGETQLRVCDSGCGLPPDDAERERSSLGLRLVHMLTDQLEGELSVTSPGGVCVEMRFRADEPGAPPTRTD